MIKLYIIMASQFQGLHKYITPLLSRTQGHIQLLKIHCSKKRKKKKKNVTTSAYKTWSIEGKGSYEVNI